MRNALAIILLLLACAHSTEYHVAKIGSDKNPGSRTLPFLTISKAAQVARPGDMITVHKGVYRERVTPPRGGTSNDERIIYQAADGEEVWIKGSEIIKGWQRVDNGVWKVTLHNSFFGDFNPYKEQIEGDWFDDRGRVHHRGEVFLNDISLFEKPTLEEVFHSTMFPQARRPERSLYTWYCESDANRTTIWANFQDHNPNEETVEISVRDACFYPDKPGRNFITVRGFHMSQAATQWAAPTAEQLGLIGTHWSKGWIIENNVISNSKCSGITLGKDRATGHNVWSKDPSKGGDVHYNEVIVRALQAGWSKENIGSHMVRNNTIFDCEQTGLCGSLGAVFSTIENNHIYDIWTKRQFQGAEIAAIKLHAAIDVLIRNNHLHNAGRGLWLDWMAQGTHVVGNLFYDNTIHDLFCEVDHGPYLIENNIFLSETSLESWSEGGAYAHNLFIGLVKNRPSRRATPFHKPHSTKLAGLRSIVNGDDRFYNNIFVGKKEPIPAEVWKNSRRRTGYGLSAFEAAELPMFVDGNVYLNGATPFSTEKNFIELADFNPAVRVAHSAKGTILHITIPRELQSLKTKRVTTERLGCSHVAAARYEHPDSSPIIVDHDYFGAMRHSMQPTPGPFAALKPGMNEIKLYGTVAGK